MENNGSKINLTVNENNTVLVKLPALLGNVHLLFE